MLLNWVMPNAPPASSSFPRWERLFFYGEDVYLHSGVVHSQYGSVDQLVAQDIEHFGAQLVGYQWYSSLLYQAGADDGFFYFGSLW